MMYDRYTYRAKRLDNGDWVYGFHIEVSHEDDDTHKHRCILPIEFCVDCDVEGRRTRMYEIDPVTLGQCTSLQDADGRDIFEGDIVEIHCGYDKGAMTVRRDVRFKDGIYGVDEAVQWSGEFDQLRAYTKYWHTVVIGNIHDNPDLIWGRVNHGELKDY